MDSLNNAIERVRNLERGVQTFRQQLQRKPKYGTDVWVQQANLYKIPVNADGSFGPNIEHPRVTYTQELHDAVVAKLATLGVDTEGLKEELKYPDWKRRFPISDNWSATGGIASVLMYATQMIGFGDYLAVGYYAIVTYAPTGGGSQTSYTLASIQARRKTTLAKTVEYVTELTTHAGTAATLPYLGKVYPYLDLDGSTVRGIGACWLNTSTNVLYRKHKTISSGVESSNTFNRTATGTNLNFTVNNGDLWLYYLGPTGVVVRTYDVNLLKVDTSEATLIGVTEDPYSNSVPNVAGTELLNFSGSGNELTDARYTAIRESNSTSGLYTAWVIDTHSQTHRSVSSSLSIPVVTQCSIDAAALKFTTNDFITISGAGVGNHPFFDFSSPFTSRVMGRHSFYANDVANPTNDPETIIGITSNGYSIAGPWQAGVTVFDLVLSSAASNDVKSRCTLYNVDKANAEITRQSLDAEVTGLNVSGNDVIVYQRGIIGQISDIYEGGIITYQQS